MNREEKINTLTAIIQECEDYQCERKEILFEIIKDLEQETVSKESYDHEYFLRKILEMEVERLKRKLLEQQPIKGEWLRMSKLSKHEAVLDKIRAEIEEYKSRQLTLAISVEDLENGKQIALEYVLGIIDKYKAESVEE